MVKLADWNDHGVPHSERRERFCGHFVETGGDKMRAFRLAFVVDPTRATTQLWRDVDKLLEEPEIKTRIKEMRDSATRASMISIQQILEDWKDIAIADPNDLVAVTRTCCRFCWGVGHRYQWINVEEWVEACRIAEENNQTNPDCTGGFGFDAKLDPRPSCPAYNCFGQGVENIQIADTRKLIGPARKLYKNARLTKDGRVEIIMHDQNEARMNLARAMGFMGKEAVPMPSEPAVAPIAALTEEQAREAYNRMIKR